MKKWTLSRRTLYKLSIAVACAVVAGVSSHVYRHKIAQENEPVPTIAPSISIGDAGIPAAVLVAAGQDKCCKEPNTGQPGESATKDAQAGKQQSGIIENVQKILPGFTNHMDDWRKFAPPRLKVAPLPELEIDFEMIEVRNEGGHTVWKGENKGVPGSYFVSVATKDAWHAVVAYSDVVESSFDIHITGNTARVKENTRSLACGNTDAACPADSGAACNSLITSASASSGAPQAANAEILWVDVLFFYDAETAYYSTKDDIATTMRAWLEMGNRVLEKSHIDNFRWRYVDCYEAPAYPKPPGTLEDINMMQNPGTALGSFVATKSNERNADQAVLLLGSARGDSVGGRGEMPGHNVVILRDSGYGTLIHELGHNFGCNHDRLEPESGASDDDDKYNYGWSEKVENPLYPDDRDKDFYYGTIMSYATTTRYAYFSNPNITVDGFTIGFPVLHPQAAYNAKIMRDNAWSMSTYRGSSAIAKPVILSQTQSITAGVNSTVTLRVDASSSGAMSYTWKKDMTVVGGNVNTLTIASAKTTDSGIYSVEVSNAGGTTSSSPMTVLITTLPIVPEETVKDSSSGGGGAVSLAYLFGLGLLFVCQVARRKR